jgi:hypothetical protein
MAEPINTESTVAEKISSSETPVMPTAEAAEKESAGTSPADEMAANISLDQLSYICEYCGKVNSIASPNCVRCGKRRPRSEYLNAMNKIKNAKTVKERYVQEEAKLSEDRREAAQQQITRLVEARVADEKARIAAQEAVRLEQDRDDIKKETARDAVRRIIAAERAAEEKVLAADAVAEEAIKGRNREADERITTEREKVLYAAAKKLVSERTGIENAAEDRIAAAHKSIEQKARETISVEADYAAREEARKAALKVVAAEQSTADRLKIEQEAMRRAADQRITEEKEAASAELRSKYAVEKSAIEKAVADRINAERKFLDMKRDAAAPYPGMQSGQAGTVQPLAIVPYVNPQQPLYQYQRIKQVYRFVPDAPADGKKKNQNMSASYNGVPAVKYKKAKKIGAVRAISIAVLILSVVLILSAVMPINAFKTIRYSENYENNLILSVFEKSPSDAYYTNVCEPNGFTGYLPTAGMLLMLAGAAVCAVFSLIGIFAGKARLAFGIFATLEAVGAVVLVAGLFVLKVVSSVNVGIILPVVLSLASLILVWIAHGKSAKAQKADGRLPVPSDGGKK